jgi:hypothetical protein
VKGHNTNVGPSDDIDRRQGNAKELIETLVFVRNEDGEDRRDFNSPRRSL